MKIEIRSGPLGAEGGKPFPEVRAEMDRIEKGSRMMRPWLIGLIPERFLVKMIRKMMGFRNRDIARGELATRRVSIPGPQGDVPVRIYTPIDPPEGERPEGERPKGEKLPILLFFHGGGWVGGSVDCVENICRGIADRAGTIVINVDYRLAPEHKFPAGLEDCYAAVEWAAQHAGELGGDPTRLGVAGDSAGANFATVCCSLAHERAGPSITHQVLIYPGLDLSGRYVAEHGRQEGAPELDLGDVLGPMYVDNKAQLADPRCSPWLIEDLSFMPPALVVTAEFCLLRDQGEAYARRLDAAGVATRAIRCNGVNHAFLDKVGVWPYADACIADIAEILRTA